MIMAKNPSEKNNKKGRRGTKIAVAIGSAILTLAVSVTAFAMVSYSGFVIYDSLHTNQAAFSSWDLTKYRPVLEEDGALSFEELQEINPDTVGWITIQGTNIDYPVVQGENDLEYASKDVFGHSSLSGSIYLTAANTRDYTNSYNLLYGHHMENGAMFGDIEKYEDYDYFHSHQDGILITTKGVYDLKIFARIGTDAYDSKIYSAGDRKSEDFPDFLEYVQSLAIQWQDGTDIYDITDRVRTYLLAREENIAENGDFVFEKMPQEAIDNGLQLLALSTCASATTNGRQLLFATMKMRTEPLPLEMINDDPVPLSDMILGHGQGDFLAIANLICMVLAVVMLVPGLTVTSKYGRIRMMKKANQEGGSYAVSPFFRKMLTGVLLEAGIAAISIVLFLRTESFSRPVTLVDQWTPLNLALVAASVAIDMIFVRYREKKTS